MKADNLTQENVVTAVYGDHKQQTNLNAILNGRRNVGERLVKRYVNGLGYPDAVVDELLRAPAPDWPKHRSPGLTLDRVTLGREGVLAELRAALTQGGDAAILPATVVRGQGGIGKSTLARYYAHRYADQYYGIWWIEAETKQGVEAGLSQLARDLGLGTDDDRDGPTLARKALRAITDARDPWLLIYDNAQAWRDLRDLRPDAAHIHCLLTSREDGWPRAFCRIPADTLSVPDAADLLMAEAARHDDRAGAEALAGPDGLAGLPLAIICAGAYLRDVAMSFADYGDRLHAMLDNAPPEHDAYEDSVYAAVSLSLDRLSDDAMLLMNVFAWLAPDDLWLGLVTALANWSEDADTFSVVPDQLWSLARDGARAQAAFAELRRRSLLTPQGDRDGVHRLTQAVVRTRHRRADDAPNWPAIAATTVAAGYPGGANSPAYAENWPACRALNRHVAALDALGPDRPTTAAMEYLYNQAGLFFSVQRQDRLALRYAMASLRLMLRRLPDDHRAVGVAWNSLAVEFSNKGWHRWAERASARAVAIADANAEIPDANRAIWLGVHGRHLQALAVVRADDPAARDDLFTRARQRMVQAALLSRRADGRDSRNFGKDLNNLANLHDAQGRGGAAVVLYRAALSIRQRVLPDGDPDLALGYNNLGAVLLRRGLADLPTVVGMLDRALQILEAAFADNPAHPNRINTARWLITAHLLAGDADAARALAGRYPTLDLDAVRAGDENIRRNWPGAGDDAG